MAESNTNPHIRENHSPLNTLAMQALRRFGDFNPGTVDGDVLLMFVEFANMIIDEIRMHPYHDGKDIDYYQSPTDVREIPDSIIVNGLLYYYAVQQASPMMEIVTPIYYRTLNHQLWQKLNGNTKIQLRVVDNGTNKKNANNGKTNKNNGTVSY